MLHFPPHFCPILQQTCPSFFFTKPTANRSAEARSLPDCTAIISISGSSRVMTALLRSSSPSTRSQGKVTGQRCWFRAPETLPAPGSCLTLQPDCENSLRNAVTNSSTPQASQDGTEWNYCRQETKKCSSSDIRSAVRTARAPPLAGCLWGGGARRTERLSESRSNAFFPLV